jgi:hypothetical protein
MFESYQWLNRAKSRYYTINVKKDEDQIILKYKWGGCHSNRGGNKSLLVRTEEEVKKYIDDMMKRRKSRGYELIAPDINLAM